MKSLALKIKLTVPTIDLLECKKIKGGYSYADGGELNPGICIDYIDDGDEEPDIDNNWFNNDNNKDPDDNYDNEDFDNDIEIPSLDEDSGQPNQLMVQVANGECAIGALASAIQYAMQNSGINLIINPETNTIEFQWGQYMAALNSFFTAVNFKSLPGNTRWEALEDLFDNGGCAILLTDEHAVCAVDYDNGVFTYYDPTTGSYEWGYAGEFRDLILLYAK